jgi:orotidine-5'-phosphate decarboxylase
MVLGQLSIKAVTVQAMVGSNILKVAVQAAEASRLHHNRTKRMAILASLLPTTMDEGQLAAVGMEGRHSHVATAAQEAAAAGVDGMLVGFKDLSFIHRKFKDMPLIATAQRPAHNYAETMPKQMRALPGVAEIMHAGAAHVIFGADLIGSCGTEWTADLVNKELNNS